MPPSLRKRHIRGREIACLTLTDPCTKTRRDFWLGPWGSAEALARGAALLSEQAADHGSLPAVAGPPKPGATPGPGRQNQR